MKLLPKLPTGITGLDEITGVATSGDHRPKGWFVRSGLYRESSVPVSGLADKARGKTTSSAFSVDLSRRQRERCLYFAFKGSLESAQHLSCKSVRFESTRPSLYGVEIHLAEMNRGTTQLKPTTGAIDPIPAVRRGGTNGSSLLLRLIDLSKSRCIKVTFADTGTAGVSAGSARVIQKAHEREEEANLRQALKADCANSTASVTPSRARSPICWHRLKLKLPACRASASRNKIRPQRTVRSWPSGAAHCMKAFQ